ncbi:RNA polymerase sigma factor [Actinomadura rudentiformis]|uniref:RNA polymerase sigma factor n=1 Tax=Actinomadura rudentiformis TaxID=359158 RepID=UPI00178C46CE|nr:sigma-70 family RNA polymerase sigma factor [Actinomadura rudentiformis]
MNDHLLVEALRSRDSGAPAALYEAYADRLYAYCWFQLRGRDAAQVALRDTFIVAESQIDRLRDPDRFGPWLYAIARLECGRRMPYGSQPPDLPVASHDQEDVDQRIMAWQAVLGLAPLSREILELRVRHQLSVPDLAAVFDLPVKEAQSALEQAHDELGVALTAEILAHQGPYGCPERGVILRGRRGEMDHDLRLRLLRHAEECPLCGAFRPRTVSAAKVYGLLPQAEPPDALRLRVMSCFLDPELVGYRLFVATRITEFTPGGFPVQPRRTVLPRRPGLSRGGALPWWQGGRRRPGLRRGEGRRTPSGAAPPGGAQPSGPSAVGSSPGGTSPGTGADERRISMVGSVVGPVAGVVRDGRLLAGARGLAVAAVVILLLGAGAAAFNWLVGANDRQTGTIASGRVPSPGVAPILPPTGAPYDLPADPGAGEFAGSPVSATFPLGARRSAAPPTALPSPPRREYHAAPDDGGRSPGRPGGSGTLSVSPLYVDLAGGSETAVTLRADGGPVTWRAKAWGPVRPSSSSGRLQNGQSVTLAVRVFRRPGGHGEGGITFLPGGQQVHITWRPEPRPSPTPTDPGTPSPTPTSPGTPPPSKPSTPPPSSPQPSSPPNSDPPPQSDPPPSSSEPPPPPPPPPSTPASDPPPQSPPASEPTPEPKGSG